MVAGLTYNFENKDTDYQNGIDWNLDWGASQFLSKQLHVGLVRDILYDDLPAIVVPVTGLAPSNRGLLLSVRSSDTSFRLES